MDNERGRLDRLGDLVLGAAAFQLGTALVLCTIPRNVPAFTPADHFLVALCLVIFWGCIARR